MNEILPFLRSRFGISAVVVCFCLILWFSLSKKEAGQPSAPAFTNTASLTTVDRQSNALPFRPSVRADATQRVTILTQYVRIIVTNAPTMERKLPFVNIVQRVEDGKRSTSFAPMGRLIPCELVNTIESIRIETPVIGVISESIAFNGRIVIPEGTEVHGKAQVDRVRERIAAHGSWVFVFPDGKELRVKGQALERQESPVGEAWGVDDGSAGLRGEILRSGSFDELKVFAASFLSGMSGALQTSRPTVFGDQVNRSARNAALAGAGSVLEDYAKSIAETIKRDGFYVRVRGGHQFWLYVSETLFPEDAAVGGSEKGR